MPLVDYGSIPGAFAACNAEDIDPAAAGPAVVFGTKQGICAGFNGGTVKNLTQDRFLYPVQERGAGIVRAHGGSKQFVMVLEGTETAAPVAF